MVGSGETEQKGLTMNIELIGFGQRMGGVLAEGVKSILPFRILQGTQILVGQELLHKERTIKITDVGQSELRYAMMARKFVREFSPQFNAFMASIRYVVVGKLSHPSLKWHESRLRTKRRAVIGSRVRKNRSDLLD
jgi:hypothetical protein